MSGLFADVATAIDFTSLGLSPIALDLGFLQLRWYSLAYIAGILVGWWYLLRLLQAPGAPMARRHADVLVTWATLGIILGGRLAYRSEEHTSELQSLMPISSAVSCLKNNKHI